MKTEIIIPIPTYSSREMWDRNSMISYGERWLEHFGLEGEVYYLSHVGIKAEVDRDEIEQLCHDFYAEMCEEERDDYRELRAEMTRGDEDIDCTNLMLNFMDQMGEFNSIE